MLRFRRRGAHMTDDATRSQPKPPPVDRLSLLWHRINEHKIVQWSVAYVALAYAIQHAVVLTAEAFEWSHLFQQISMLLLAFGVPVVATAAWYHGEKASRRISGPELTIITLLLLTSSLLFYVFVRPSETAPAIRETKVAATQAGAAAAPRVLPNSTTAISIAVLPFDNISGDASQEYFSDGMTEEITAALAKVPDLRVVARTSAFQFKAQNRDVQSIGQQLHATHFIEGSVRKAGERVRITAQLIKADDGSHIWAESYDRDLKDVFAVQEDIARAIATSLRTPLGLQQGKALISNRNIDPESYQQYLRAKALVRARGLKPLTDAAHLLEQVVTRNPNYAPTWALLAQVYIQQPNFEAAYVSGEAGSIRGLVSTATRRAEAAAERSIQLDGKESDAYLALGLVRARNAKLVAAQELYDKALLEDPNNPEVLQQSSDLFAAVGHLKEALDVRNRLLSVEPFVPVYNRNGAIILWLNGQTDAAITMLRNLPVDYATRGPYLAQVYAASGRFAEAAETLSQTPSAAFHGGLIDSAVRLLRMAPKKVDAPQEIPHLGLLGFVHLYVGDPARILEFYEGNMDVGIVGPINTSMLWHVKYAEVRRSARFKAFVRRAGLVEYWRAKGWPPQCHPTTGDDFACE
jgi:TolB-like protein